MCSGAMDPTPSHIHASAGHAVVPVHHASSCICPAALLPASLTYPLLLLHHSHPPPPPSPHLQGREPGPLHVAIPEEELGTRNMMRKLSAQGMNGQMFNTEALKNMGGMGGGGDDEDEDEGGEGAAPFDFGAAGAAGADYEDDLSAEEIADMGIQDVARGEAGKGEL